MPRRGKIRGSYKPYLRDSAIEIPESTMRSRKKKPINQQDCDIDNGTDDAYNQLLPEIQYTDNDGEVDYFVDASDGLENIDNDVSDDEEYNIFNGLNTDDNIQDLPLYEGCDLTKAESELLLLSLSLKHHFTNKALEDVIHTIDCHLPNVVHKSKYRFLKAFKETEIIEYYYCPECPANLNFIGPGKTAECEFCKKVYNKINLKEEGFYFYYLPLKKQFMDIVNSPLYSQFRKQSDTSDVINGSVYKDMLRKNIIGVNDFTIQWNTDGVSLFKTSKRGVTPVIVTINELPYRVRKNNAILASLFYGNKPPMNVYLRPFIEELRELSITGFRSSTFGSTKEINTEVHTVFASVDSVARPQVQNMTQFNGEYGCSYCYHKGETATVGRGFTRVYRGNIEEPRSHNSYLEDLKHSVENDVTIKGVKGSSITLQIPYFNMIHGFPPDYMHACLLGVAKLFPTEWFDSKNNQKEWYLGHKLKEFNDKLISIKPPTEITRIPQNIIESKYKASEWKNFLLYYSLVCLHGLMSTKLLKHWLLFVYSMYIFLQEKISEPDFFKAKDALYKFVNNIEDLYGKEFMKFNVHILLHIPDYIEKYGALWAWSAFPYENFNGVIKYLFHGTQCISIQICKSYGQIRNIKNSSNIFNRPNCSEDGKAHFISMMKECRIQQCVEFGNHLRLFGKPLNLSVSLNTKLVIEQLLESEIQVQALSYNRFIYRNSLFHTINYERLKKRNNSTIVTSDGDLLDITNVMAIRKINSEEDTYIILGKNLDILNQEICNNNRISSNCFSFIVRESSTITAVNVNSIKKKCIKIPHSTTTYCVIPLVNVIETD